MKHLFTLGAFMLAAVFVFGQTPWMERKNELLQKRAEQLEFLLEGNQSQTRERILESWLDKAEGEIQLTPTGMRSAREGETVIFDSTVTQVKLPNGEFQNDSKEEFFLDSEGNLLENAFFVWINGAWVGQFRTTTGFDTQGRPMADTSWAWDMDQMDWFAESVRSFTLDEEGRVLQTIVQEYDSATMMLVLAERIIVSFDEDGIRTGDTFEVWNSADSSWTLQGRSIVTINQDSTEIVTIFEEADSTGNLVPVSRLTDIFDSDGNSLEFLVEEWFEGEWIPFIRFVSTYEEGRIVTDTLFANFGFGFGVVSVDEYSYNEAGQLTELNSFSQGFLPGSPLELTGRWSFDYDSLGNPILEEVEEVSLDTLMMLMTVSETSVEYNTDQPISGILAPSFFSFLVPVFPSDEVVSQPLVATTSTPDSSGTLQESRKTTFYYTDQVTSIRSVYTLDAEVFPNPATDFVTIDWETTGNPAFFELFDLQGRQVLEQRIFGRTQVAVDGLSAGIYVFRLRDGEEYAAGKIVIR